MGKIKTTRKSVVSAYSNIVSIGYCDAQNLLRCADPVAYTMGTYGWNFDVYYIGGVAICTGYRGMPGRRARNVEKYESLAAEVWRDYSKTWEEQRQEVEDILREFVAQA